jgi:hypothetical protein
MRGPFGVGEILFIARWTVGAEDTILTIRARPLAGRGDPASARMWQEPLFAVRVDVPSGTGIVD